MERPTNQVSNQKPTSASDHRNAHREVPVSAERALRGPLGALRVLLECMGTLPGADQEMRERALREVTRAERAASDLVDSKCERIPHAIHCSVAEITASLKTTLDREDRRRCHFVIDGDDAPMNTDGRMVVNALERSIRHRLDSVDELLVHVHVADDRASFTLVDAPEETQLLELFTQGGTSGSANPPAPSLADTLLERDFQLLGGSASVRTTNGHRCVVANAPLILKARNTQETAA